jgi:hypothetical protein
MAITALFSPVRMLSWGKKLPGLNLFLIRGISSRNLNLTGTVIGTERFWNPMNFIRLKDTKMPIKEIQKYAKLRADGDPTIPERMEMLINHRVILKNEIEQLQELIFQ